MERPDPDALLARFKAEEDHHGKLKIFFGMCPGVGKTYAMLQEARQRQAEGFRVLVGVVMTHGRPETRALLQGLEQIPLKKVNYRGITIEEMDIDEILKRHPQLVLVDELAHTNAPGSRHPKRYQDVLEILAADIDVFTTLNVQHVDSRREDILAVTRIAVGETVPDTILDEASEITLVDLSPQALHQRLAEGKVYVPDQAQAAAVNFFKTENLTALREMALRLTTAHVNRNLRSLMLAKGLSGPSKSGERILVAVGITPFSESLIRMTRRWAGMLDASWIALHVEGSAPLTEEHKERLMKNLTLARQLGAEIIHRVGDDLAQVIVDVANKENVTQIIFGKSSETRWQRFLGIPTVADRLVALSGQIDVHMVRMSAAEKNFPSKPNEFLMRPRPREYGLSFLMFVIATIVNMLLAPWTGYEVLGLLYLLTVVLSGSFLGRSAAFMLAALSAFAWDYLFIPPKFALHLRTTYDIGVLGMFFITALMMGFVTSKLRRQKEIEQKQRQRSESLYELTRALALSTDIAQAMRLATAQINLLLQCHSSVFMVDESEQPLFANPLGDPIDMTPNQKGLVQWVVANKKAAGRFSDTLPQQPLMYLPLMSSGQVRAIVVIKLLKERPLDLAQRTLLESFTALMTVMLEKDQLLKISREAKMKEDTQNLQSALLDNLSHELKTPLTIISGYLDALILFHQWPKDAMELLDECRLACLRLTSGVDAVLDLTKLDVGNLSPNFAWCEVKDIVAHALKQVGTSKDEKRIHVDCPQGPVYVNADFYMITQALKNIVHNALVHGPEGLDIDIHVRVIDQKIRISVIDQGEGISKQTLAKIFDKFYRGAKTRKGGLGLGLSIARRFVQLNEGEVEAENLSPKGFMVTITLPMAEKE
ncbi:MAG: sensor histidine kinase KdpD [Candidatus Omnitrophica bacterium]|nr:sensor histidine kinase KdpD [Candidatus Omnitrophota bacterium]MDE2213762.1 sensor histidine kinase KdpD [Candidatus Omnitrophota bacterium]